MEVKFDLVSVSFDSETLHGLYCKSLKSRGTVIHLHGTWGNFYANPFIKPLAKMYIDNGYDFLTINIVGHDETSINENFEKSIKSIEFWIGDVKPTLPLILQGHSLGALKVLRLIKNKSSILNDVSAVVLLSPFDIVSFYLSNPPSDNKHKKELVSKLIAEGKGDENLPLEVFNLWQISNNTYFSAIEEGAYLDLFNARNGSFIDISFSGFNKKILVALGNNDFASTPKAGEMKHLIDAKCFPNVTTILIDNAPHNFAGCVNDLSEAIKIWLG